MNLKRIFSLLFFDFSPNIMFPFIKLYRCSLNIVIEGTVSQNFYLGLSFCFMSKNVKLFVIFLQYIFLDYIK